MKHMYVMMFLLLGIHGLIAMDQLLETVAKNEANIFAHSSLFNSLVAHAHGAQVVTALESLTPQLVTEATHLTSGQAPALPTLTTANPQQAAIASALQAAQQVENNLAANPSKKAMVLRIVIGLGASAFAVGDLIATYVYAQKSTNNGQKATSGVFSAGTDLSILSFGAYQTYLGITNWDAKAKQNDAAVATKLIQGHIATRAQPVAAVSSPAAPINV